MKRMSILMASVLALAVVFAGCFNPEPPTAPTVSTDISQPLTSSSTSVTTELILCLDVSGSISSSELNTEIEGLKACIQDQNIVPQNGTAAVGIVVYGVSAVKRLATLTPITPASLSGTIIPILNDIKTNRGVGTGATNIGDGLIKSREILATGSGLNQFILLVGDGASNTGPSVSDQCNITANAGITICSIAVGATTSGINQLRDCALATGGEFGNAPTFNDFEPVCQRCLFVVFVGFLDLTPDFDLNPTGTDHTVTATLKEDNPPTFPPLSGVTVDFEVISGPNAGVNGSDVTDANGEATFTYTGLGGIGTDVIKATATDPNTGSQLTATAEKEWFNSPPTCDIDDVTVECTGGPADVALQANASDPDGDPLTYQWSTDCPGASFDDATSATPVLTLDASVSGSCTVTLVVSDGLASANCTATVEVVDTQAPVIEPSSSELELWPPNHKYHKISVEDCIDSVVDACDGAIDLSSVEVLKVASDELENSMGKGDGNTVDDIVIVCPNEVYLRAERYGTGNGRVYTIVWGVTDAAGNVATVECTVGVPHDQMPGSSAIAGPGPGYTETQCMTWSAAVDIIDDGHGTKLGK